MMFEDDVADFVQGALDRFDLLQNIHAIRTIFIEHPLDALDVTPDRRQPAPRILPRLLTEP
jgi:hypothetical protein